MDHSSDHNRREDWRVSIMVQHPSTQNSINQQLKEFITFIAHKGKDKKKEAFVKYYAVVLRI